MSLAAFIPANTQKARTSGISAFERMLKAENVSMEVIHACILGDNTGKTLAAVMDRFGYHLATYEGKKGKLSHNTAISYYRNVKLCFFYTLPHRRVPTELILLKQGKTLEKHCLKRDNGGFTNKAPACTKDDLHSFIRYVYSTAAVASDYEDAALACLMWHCFGRSSDLGYVSKQHITIPADNVFFVRMLRVKTAEEQGLTLVPDRADFLTCPLHTLAVALVMQEAPCPSLLSQLPLLAIPASTALDAGAPLLEMLQVDRTGPASAAVASFTLSSTPPTLPASTAPAPSPAPAPACRRRSPAASRPHDSTHTRGEDGIQAYVNRFLKRVAGPAGAASSLTSHSFRRGGAQHANSDDRLSSQWIFDRGSWDMTRTNKGFAYVFNTPREDRKVARVLSGWRADEVPSVADIAVLDHGAQERLARLQGLLFGCCTGLEDVKLNVSRKVLGVLVAYLIKYLPQMKTLAPGSLYVTRVEVCFGAAGILLDDMLVWSSALNAPTTDPVHKNELQEAKTNHCKSECRHAAVINERIENNRFMAARPLALEAAVLQRPTTHEPITQATQEEEASPQVPQAKRRKKATTNLSSMWFEWYTRLPRVWDSSDRQKKSDYRLVVAYMKLFLDGGFQLREEAVDFKDRVLAVGQQAEAAVLAFLSCHSIRAKGGSSVLREMRKLHRGGGLDARIVAYRNCLAVEKIIDPAPVGTQDILQVVGHV